jgi:hypothetical protein
MDEVTQVVMTETQKELLNEIHTQYKRRVAKLIHDGVDPLKTRGNLTLHIPYEMLREAFVGEPPVKEG